MNKEQLLEIWNRTLDDETLSTHEDDALFQAIDDDARLQQQLENDLEIHALISSLPSEFANDADSFVRETMQRIESGKTNDLELPAQLAAFESYSFDFSKLFWSVAIAAGILILLTSAIWMAQPPSQSITDRDDKNSAQNESDSTFDVQKNDSDVGEIARKSKPENTYTESGTKQTPSDLSGTPSENSRRSPARNSLDRKNVASTNTKKEAPKARETPYFAERTSFAQNSNQPQQKIFKSEKFVAKNEPVSFRLKSNTEIELDPESQIEFLSENSLQLIAGRLHAKVPAEAIGFTVQVGDLSVVDLGTEFTVDANENGTSVRVDKGKVELRSKKLRSRPIELSASPEQQFVWISSNFKKRLNCIVDVQFDSESKTAQLIVNGKSKTYSSLVEAQRLLADLQKELQPVEDLLRKSRRGFRGKFSIDNEQKEFSTAAQLVKRELKVAEKLLEFVKELSPSDSTLHSMFDQFRGMFGNDPAFNEFENRWRNMMRR